MIKSALHGGSPCVRLDGTIFVPSWLDERREHRRPLGWSVWLEVEHTCEAVILRDVSAGGVGLESCRARAVGTAVKVHLPSSRVLQAIVTWSHASRIGAKFAQPLKLDDPIFIGSGAAPHVEIDHLIPATYNG